MKSIKGADYHHCDCGDGDKSPVQEELPAYLKPKAEFESIDDYVEYSRLNIYQ